MLELTILSIKERLWPAGIVAFVMHSAVIAGVAFGGRGSQGSSPQDFQVEVMFASMTDVKTRGAVVPSSLTKAFVDLSSKNRDEQSVSRLKASSSAQNSLEKKASSQPIFEAAGQPSGGTHDPFPIYNPPPIYPFEAKQKRIQGIVLVRLSITESGTVHKATALSPRIDPILENAALKAIYQWRFKPGIKTVEVPIEFKLEA